ncbi:MAG: hypothetical protein ACK4JX_04445 [Flavobacterium sp.]
MRIFLLLFKNEYQNNLINRTKKELFEASKAIRNNYELHQCIGLYFIYKEDLNAMEQSKLLSVLVEKQKLLRLSKLYFPNSFYTCYEIRSFYYNASSMDQILALDMHLLTNNDLYKIKYPILSQGTFEQISRKAKYKFL